MFRLKGQIALALCGGLAVDASSCIIVIEEGHNAAIAVFGVGVQPSSQWLEKLVAPFEDVAVQAVAGFFRPSPQTVLGDNGCAGASRDGAAAGCGSNTGDVP